MQENRWTSRKFWSAMAWQVVFTALVVKEVVTPEIFYNLTLITLGGYFVANVAQRWVQKEGVQQ